MQPKRFYVPLKAVSGGDAVTIDPTSSALTAAFKLSDLPIRHEREWCFLEKIRFWTRAGVDQPAADGSIIRFDQLYRIYSSFSLKSDDLGFIYGPSDVSGPQMGLIGQVVSNGYTFPFLPSEDIAAADGDTARIVPIELPLAHRCFTKGHQTGVWNGFFRGNGQVDVTFAGSTALAAVSAAAALEATFDVRAEAVYTTEPEARLPQLWHWRTHETPGNETKHAIPDICRGTGIRGTNSQGKTAFLAYLSNLAGLGGAGAISNIQRVFPRDRGQQTHDLGTPFFGPASYLADFVSETLEKVIFPSAKGQGYPYQLGTAINGVPNAATALFLPYWFPDVEGQEVSKLQEWQGSYGLEQTYTAIPTGQAKWMGLELSYFTEDHKAYLADRMGLPLTKFDAVPKMARGMRPATDAMSQFEQARKIRGIPEKLRAR